jgi:hypothetical protein
MFLIRSISPSGRLNVAVCCPIATFVGLTEADRLGRWLYDDEPEAVMVSYRFAARS